jgi:hypothetical protein
MLIFHRGGALSPPVVVMAPTPVREIGRESAEAPREGTGALPYGFGGGLVVRRGGGPSSPVVALAGCREGAPEGQQSASAGFARETPKKTPSPTTPRDSPYPM